MDFRFHTAMRDFLLSIGLKDQYDVVSLAGSAKGLAGNDPVETEFLFKQIALSTKLHAIKEIYLIHHMDCGAYGGHGAFATLAEERAKQTADLEQARQIITNKFPGLAVNKVLARIEVRDGQNHIDFAVVG